MNTLILALALSAPAQCVGGVCPVQTAPYSVPYAYAAPAPVYSAPVVYQSYTYAYGSACANGSCAVSAPAYAPRFGLFRRRAFGRGLGCR